VRRARTQPRAWPSYLFKQDRQGPLDYLCEFDHEDLDRAKESVLWHGEWERQTDQVLNVMGALGLLRGDLRVLDVGCGVGRVTSALLGALDAFVVAVDRSPCMRRHAETALAPWIEAGRTVVVDSVESPAANRLFDLAILVEVAQHVPEPELEVLLDAIDERLAPGGRVFVYGNERLDVDRNGAAGATTVASVVERALRVTREDVWLFEPNGTRYSLLAERR
jgi:2-polyprenyl-3-methyl-5-hydroxy-6-metoxy-1,4-benzoquinol methylase